MTKIPLDSFGSVDTLGVGDRSYTICRIGAIDVPGVDVARLPFSKKILLENLLRFEDGVTVTQEDILAVVRGDRTHEIAYRPARVLLHDLSGIPALMDLAALRDAAAGLGADPANIGPIRPVEFVIDHSVRADTFGDPNAYETNVANEYARYGERYGFIKWAQKAFHNVRVLPPGVGIMHQVNFEFLARVVFGAGGAGRSDDATGGWAYPDTCVGTDSHTPMVNGLGVLGWGVGAIEAEGAMLGEPTTMLVPRVVGVRLEGLLREGVTSTDLVLALTQRLRKAGVQAAFVEYFGSGLSTLGIGVRTTIANMAPEYGSTVAISPIDAETISYLRLTGRSPEHVALVEAYAKAQGLYRTDDDPQALYDDVVEFDLGSVAPSMAGPSRPQQRLGLADVPASFATFRNERGRGGIAVADEIADGAVAIAAITSCTNTSNPAVMIGAGLVAKRAVELGLDRKPWVKTTLAPGSRVVTDYLRKAGLMPYLEALGFYLVGYGCTTCGMNGGPLTESVDAAIAERNVLAVAVLSSNRNFEGRIPGVDAAYLASPPLVVAYALAGRIDVDMTSEPIGTSKDGTPVYLADLWPTNAEIETLTREAVTESLFRLQYADVFSGDERWELLPAPEGVQYAWDPSSDYLLRPPTLEGVQKEPPVKGDITGARVLGLFGDGVTTDILSPEGPIGPDSPAGKFLSGRGLEPAAHNTYGSRRGNHEVKARGAFDNKRMRNVLVDVEGNVTVHADSGERGTMYDVAMRYASEGTPLIVIAGNEWGTGSSRDWAARGPRMLGVRAIIAESFERIHRSNLVGMGILPLQFQDGDTWQSLGLRGDERYDVLGLADLQVRGSVTVHATAPDGRVTTFTTMARLDTPRELDYYNHDGIMPLKLRELMNAT